MVTDVRELPAVSQHRQSWGGDRNFGLDLTLKGKKLYDTPGSAASDGEATRRMAHVDARKTKLYDFRFDYRNIAYFNAVPSYANPSGPDGLASWIQRARL
jgi:hypothetical protein